MRSTSLSEWAGTLTGLNATMVNRLWRALAVLYPVIYLILAIGTLLSSWGLAFVNWGFLFLWLSFAIALLVSPYPWQLIAVLGLGKEVLGGEEGFEFEDWFSRFKSYGRGTFEFWTVYVLVCPSVAFIYLALSDTTSAVGLHLVLILVLTLCIFISAYLWPKSQTVVRFLMACIILLCLILLSMGIKNSLQRQMLDPATRIALEANEAIEEAQQAADKKKADTIHQTLRAGHKLGAEDQKWWDALQVRRREQGPFERFKSLWQSPTDKARKAAEAGAQGTMNDRLNKLSQSCYLTAQASNEVLLPGDLDRCTVEFITRREQCLRQVNAAAEAASEPVKDTDVKRCHKTGRWAAKPAAAKTPPAQQPAEIIEPVTRPTRIAATDPKDWTCTPFKEFDYNVQQQENVKIPVGPGRYELSFTGMRQHVFHRKVRGADGRETEKDERYATCLIDADGKLANCTDMAGKPLPDFTVKHEELSRYLGQPLTTPDLKEPYGKIVVRHDGKVAVTGAKGRFEVKEDSPVVGINVDRYSLNYGGGTDALYNYHGTLSRCEAK
ncbi:MAG: hypothetical protein ACEQSB_03385 [Undibacterium sp.]